MRKGPCKICKNKDMNFHAAKAAKNNGPYLNSNLDKVSKKGNGLKCFPQAHFVSEDAVEARLVELEEPVQALQLIIF